MNKIKFLRNKRNISQEKLAIQAKISRTHLSDIETGKAKPSVDVAQRIALSLETQIEDIFFDNTVV